MSTPQPSHCRPEAFAFLADQLPVLETPRGLLRAAVAVSMHELASVQPTTIERQIEAFAARIRDRTRSHSPQALLAHAHEVLFEEIGFTGNREDYYNPHNSYLPVVLTARRGLPILLVLLYKSVLDRLGLRVHGINAPAHFIAGVEICEASYSPPHMMRVDPFDGGRVLSDEEVFERIEQLVGRPLPRDPSLLAPATHRQWLLRIVQNLIHAFDRLGRRDDLAAMIEMQSLIADYGR